MALEEGLDFAVLRQAAFDTHLKARLASAAAAHAEDTNKDDETFPCQHCSESADYWCKDCGCFICDDCRDKNPAGHEEETHTMSVRARIST